MAEDAGDGSGSTTAIQLAAGSWLRQAHGLNRFGMTREVVQEQAGNVVECSWLGFMTSSPEKTFGQARNAFLSHDEGLSLAVSEGSVTREQATARLAHIRIDGSKTWVDCPAIADRIAHGQLPQSVTERVPRCGAPLLSTVRRLMRLDAGKCVCAFVHNGSEYHLEANGRPDGGEHLRVLHARIRKPEDGSGSEFRVWYDRRDSTFLPYRFEFRPRDYLHLTFESDEAAGGPSIRPLIERESPR